MILREPEDYSQERYDIIIVGGGIYGGVLCYEAAQRGLRPLLLEKSDFGSATSGNSLRIVHGGLRYLQHMALRRFRKSVEDRRWHLQRFPDLIKPLACMMPLYGKGLKCISAFRIALALNDLLSRDRNCGIVENRQLAASRIASVEEVCQSFPRVIQTGLQGAGVWYDALMLSTERILIEVIRAAVAWGGKALNYMEAVALEQHNGRASGVRAVDHVSGREHIYHSLCIINCAGPWCRDVASSFDRDVPVLYRKSLAFNLLFDCPSVSDYAMALTPEIPDAMTYFVLPWKGKILAGTRHLACDESIGASAPTEKAIFDFISELNGLMPGLGLDRCDVRRVYSGMLPALKAGQSKMARRPMFYDHGQHSGPIGLISISGVKWTTAHNVADRILKMVYEILPKFSSHAVSPPPFEPQSLTDMKQVVGDMSRTMALFRQLVDDESIVWIDDLLLRRMDGLDSDVAMLTAAHAAFVVMRNKGKAPQAHWDHLLEALATRQDRSYQVLQDAGLDAVIRGAGIYQTEVVPKSRTAG